MSIRVTGRELTGRPRDLANGEDVLVAATGQVDDDDLVLGHGRRALDRLGDGVGAERRDDAFDLGQRLEGIERFLVGCGDIGDAARIVQPGMLGADAG